MKEGSCWEVARILEPHVNRVVVICPDHTDITSARAKTDELDARALASRLWKGELEAVWMPDERCRILRRRLARREQLVRSRSRALSGQSISFRARPSAADPSQGADQPDMADPVRRLRPPGGLQVGQQVELAAVVGPVAIAARRNDAQPIAAPAE
jgi:hypothetical protein